MRCCWSEPIKNPAGKVLGAFGMYYDHPALPNEEERRDLESAARLTGIIMERKRSEELLKESKDFLSTIIDNIPDMIFVKDAADLRFVRFNIAGEKLLGYGNDSLLGKNDYDLFSKDQADFFTAKDREVLESGRILDIPEEHILTKSRGPRVLHTKKIPVSDQDGRPLYLLGISEDITERKIFEAEHQRRHKLESIGILAGGIAHDFNNLLAGILNHVYIAKMYMDRESKEYKSLESAEKAISRAANLTQQLLTFSRGGTPVKKTASIVELIKESAEFVLSGSHVKCEYSFEDNLWPVDVDSAQISQVIHNLILNADQSMPAGGTIRISGENVAIESNTDLLLQKGRYIRITIEDQGTGISAEYLKDVFDPYFTTKEMGRGLGLSISYSIIKQHGGRILVESEIEVGTTFTIYLPASEHMVEVNKDKDDLTASREGKILIMDDEESIRSSMQELLMMGGWVVECAKDGDEAIELYKKALETSRPFDVVILDLTVPGGMGGKETITKLLELNSNVKAVVSSGYSNNPVMADYEKYGFSDVYNKASDRPERLYHILRKLLE